MKTTSFNHSVSIGIGLLTVYFHIPASHSLKDKRNIVKSILSRIQNEFKVSSAEVGYQNSWQECMIAFTTVSNDAGHCESVLQNIYNYLSNNFHDIIISDHQIEIL
jgi:uncharacterized protein